MSQNHLVRIFVARRFPIPAQGARLRKQRVDFCFDFLASQPIFPDLLPSTLWTGLWLLPLISATMTEQPFVFIQMQGQRRFAVWTFQHKSAVTAEDVGGGPAPVEKQDGLLPSLQRGLQLVKQEPAKDSALTRFQLIPHIYNVNGRQAQFDDPFWQIQFMNVV